MSRFLFVVPPLTGHINPTVAVGAELAARGHDVAWAGHPATLRPLLPDHARVCAVLDDAFTSRLLAERERWLPLRGAAVLKFFWEDFCIPLAQAMFPGVMSAVASYQPDVIVADQQALAGAAAARQARIAWATSATTPAELLHTLASMPKVDEWVRGQITGFQRGCGLTDPADLRFSDQLVIAFTTSALLGDTSSFPDHYVFTGPALRARPDRGAFPWEWLDPARRHVLVSLGTLNGPAGMRFFATAVDALADLGQELQAIIVGTPTGAVPSHILFAEHVPQLALLPHLSGVVCHGGHNTVCEALAHGVPLVVAPVRDDQPIIAQQVADVGAGLRVRFGRLRPAELADALGEVLGQPRYARAARLVAESFAAAGGAVTAASHLEKLT